MTRPAIRTYFADDGSWIHNLGDALVPYILDALGFDCVTVRAVDARVVNPGRCLLVIGSLLASRDLHRFDLPIDVWGCGWRGLEAWRGCEVDAAFHAVRGPLTRSGLGLAPAVALGDPALLFARFFRRPRQGHGLTVVFQHIDRVGSTVAHGRAAASGCDLVRSTWVYAEPSLKSARRLRFRPSAAAIPRSLGPLKGAIHPLWNIVDVIAGATFVLTGSLHAAILAQAYGVAWAAFDDGYIDTPSKWDDWGAYLGVDVAFVRTLTEGQQWWNTQGQHGRIRPLAPLLASFPYIDHSPTAQQLLKTL